MILYKKMKNNKQYIIWEGPDEVGKTSTRKLVEKARKGKDIMIDRFIGSNLVYGNLYARYTEKEILELKTDEKRFIANFDAVLIYLYAPVKTIVKRIQNDRHEEIDEKTLKDTLKEYNEYFKNSSYTKKIKIDTSKYDQKAVVKIILSFLKSLEHVKY